MRNLVSCILALFIGGGCTAGEPPKITEPAEANTAINEESDSYIIDAQSGSIANIAVGMTENEIREAGWLYETRTEVQEGDEYKIYDIRLADDVYLKCTFDLDGILARIESVSSVIRDNHGLGVGSRLSELKRAYPNGKFIKGSAEGRFANFLTGMHLRFYFNHKDLDESCFDYKTDCTIDENITVKSVAIG